MEKTDDLLGKNPHRRAVTKKPLVDNGNPPRKREEDLDDSL